MNVYYMSGTVLGTTDTKRVTLYSQEAWRRKKDVKNYATIKITVVGTNAVRIKKERVQNKAMVRYGVKGIIALNPEDQTVHQKVEWVTGNGEEKTFQLEGLMTGHNEDVLGLK